MHLAPIDGDNEISKIHTTSMLLLPQALLLRAIQGLVGHGATLNMKRHKVGGRDTSQR